MALQNKTVANAITLDATKATFTGTLKFQAVNGVRVIGGKFDATGGSNAYGKSVVVYSSSNISFDKVSVISSVNYPEAGISFQNVTNGQVTNSTFTNVGVGVGVTGSNHISLTGNKVVGATKDGFDVYDDHFVLVSGNSCSGGQPEANAHPDCVQLASTAGHPSVSDIVVTNNIATGATQGFTSFLGKGTGSLRITISQNIVNSTFPQGIACYSCVDSFITNNYLSAEPGAAHFVNMNIIGGSDNTVTGNSWLSDAVYLPTDYASAYFKLTGTAYVPTATHGSDGAFGDSAAGSMVPEPGQWMLMIFGFVIVGLGHRRHARMVAA
ncbi:MAG: right-handed parallel beta-helix repeat-containing protein [Janthinobacterium lividum]